MGSRALKTSSSGQPPLKIDSTLPQKHPYFEKTIRFVNNNTQIQCLTCKKGLSLNFIEIPEKKYTFAATWLPYHLNNKSHKNKYESDRKGLVEATKLLGKDINFDEDNEESIDEETKDPEEATDTEVPEDNRRIKVLSASKQVVSNEQPLTTKTDIVTDSQEPHSKQKEIELVFDLAEFMITKHLPFNSAPDILDFAKKLSKKYSAAVLENTKTSSTTMTRVVRYCIGSTFKEKIFSCLEQSPFSILLDNSSDIYGDNYMAILVRYFHNFRKPPITRLLAVVEIGASSTGASLLELVQEEMFNNDYNIINNIVGICTDGGSNMISTQGSGLSNRLQTFLPALIHVKDLCHAYNGIAKEATKCVPKFAVDFVKEVCGYINKSTQRQAAFRDFMLEKKKNDRSFNPNHLEEAPEFKEIRWLSLSNVANFVSKYWNDLKTFYQSIDVDFKENFTTEYLLWTNLLALLLKKLHYYTNHFQSGTYIMNHVVEKMKTSYSEFIAYLLKPPFDRPEKEPNYFEIVFPFSIDPQKGENLKNINDFEVFFLDKFESFKPLLTKIAEEDSSIGLSFIKAAKDFISTTVTLMKDGLLFQNAVVMNSLIAYWPITLDKTIWTMLAKHLTNVIQEYSEFQSELDRFCASYGRLRPTDENPQPEKILEVWADNEIDYPLLTKLARALIVLPYTSAEVESKFSKFKVVKSPYRNRLTTTNIETSLLAEEFFGSKNFEILPEMFLKYTTMWDTKTNKNMLPSTTSKVAIEVQCDLAQEPTALNKDSSEEKNALSNALRAISHLFYEPDPEESDSKNENIEYYHPSDSFKRRISPLSKISEEGIKKVKVALDLLTALFPDLSTKNEEKNLSSEISAKKE